jgi:hypothetical protein
MNRSSRKLKPAELLKASTTANTLAEKLSEIYTRRKRKRKARQ